MTGFWPAICAQFGHRAIHQLGVLGGFAQADVDRDLLDLRHGHDVLVAELLGQRRDHFLLIVLSQTCCHGILTSCPASGRTCGRPACAASCRRRPHPRDAPMRTALLQPGQTIITLEAAMGLSRSAMPPLICLAGLGRVWRLIIITCSTSTLPVSRSTRSTRPVLPLSRPGDHLDGVFLLEIDAHRLGRLCLRARHQITSGASETIFMNRLFAQFPGDGAEHARAHRLADIADQHRRVGIEADVGAVLAPGLLAHADDHAAHHFALLDRRIGRGLFHAGRDHVAQAGAQAEVAAARQNAGQPARAGVVGHLENRSHSNHKISSSS